MPAQLSSSRLHAALMLPDLVLGSQPSWSSLQQHSHLLARSFYCEVVNPVPVCRPLRGAWTQPPCWSSQPITEQPNNGRVQKILRASTEEPSDRPDGKCFTQKGIPKTAAVLINPVGMCEWLRALCLSIITLNKLKKSFLQQRHEEHRTCGDNYCWPRIKMAPAL